MALIRGWAEAAGASGGYLFPQANLSKRRLQYSRKVSIRWVSPSV